MSFQQKAGLRLSLALLGCGMLFCFSPLEHGFYPPCIFHALTGWQCPGCGGTRAAYYLLHLNFHEAMRYNALVTIAAPAALLWFVFRHYSVIRYGSAPKIQLPRSVVICLGAVTVGFGVLRNVNLSF